MNAEIAESGADENSEVQVSSPDVHPLLVVISALAAFAWGVGALFLSGWILDKELTDVPLLIALGVGMVAFWLALDRCLRVATGNGDDTASKDGT